MPSWVYFHNKPPSAHLKQGAACTQAAPCFYIPVKSHQRVFYGVFSGRKAFRKRIRYVTVSDVQPLMPTQKKAAQEDSPTMF